MKDKAVSGDELWGSKLKTIRYHWTKYPIGSIVQPAESDDIIVITDSLREDQLLHHVFG